MAQQPRRAERVANRIATLLPGLLFIAFAVWPALLKFQRLTARWTPDSTLTQSRWTPKGGWLGRVLSGALLAGYISLMTTPRVQSIEPRIVAPAEESVMTAGESLWFPRLGKLFSWMLTSLAALLLVLFILWMTLPRLFNVQALIVLTGSMEPTLPVGSVALVNDSGASEVGVGDIITFEHREDGRPVLITHRVIEVVTGAQSPSFRTQGDANSIPDNWIVPGDTVVGEVTQVVPYVGYLTDEVRGRNGFLALMAIPGAIIVFGEVRKIARELRVIRQKDVAA